MKKVLSKAVVFKLCSFSKLLSRIELFAFASRIVNKFENTHSQCSLKIRNDQYLRGFLVQRREHSNDTSVFINNKGKPSVTRNNGVLQLTTKAYHNIITQRNITVICIGHTIANGRF